MSHPASAFSRGDAAEIREVSAWASAIIILMAVLAVVGRSPLPFLLLAPLVVAWGGIRLHERHPERWPWWATWSVVASMLATGIAGGIGHFVR